MLITDTNNDVSYHHRKKIMKKFIAAVVMSASVLATPAPGHAQTAPITINQGDQIISDQTILNGSIYIGNPCTIGYVEPGKAWTAAHCANNGNPVKNSQGRVIGTIVHTNPNDSNRYSVYHDTAYIALNSNVRAGQNSHVSEVSEVVPSAGDRVCLYSRTSDSTRCGTVDHVSPTAKKEYVSISGVSANQGDSGGPAWVPGQGFIGVVSSRSSSGNVGIARVDSSQVNHHSGTSTRENLSGYSMSSF